MTHRLAVVTAALVLAAPAFAGELSPQEVGKIQAEQKRAVEKVRAANGNRKEADMSPEERRDEAARENQAALGVLQKHGVDDKAFTRYSNRMDRSAQAEAKEAEKQEEKRAQANKSQAKPSEAAADEVEVQAGIDASHPVEIDVDDGQPKAKGGKDDEVIIETLPQDAANPAPARSKHSSRRRHR
jgi:hypothetical protein